ncbi:MAG: N-acetylmuramoyl-L-alanine amidase [Planctomycetes bacterium]|nr:N-acetylmuramoyl-L-alanine amidase [Planctomycetota bacterium]
MAPDKVQRPAVTLDPAPHFTDRDAPREIRYIIIHTIEGSARSAIGWFKNPASHVSAHYVIAYDGSITQMVDDQDVAWHAGTREHNDHGIGIEHEGYASQDGWTRKQLVASAALGRWLCATYGIQGDRAHILGHEEIAPGRRSDPGPHFPWDRYLAMIRTGRDPRAEPAPPVAGGAAAPAASRDPVEEALARAQGLEERGDDFRAVEGYRRLLNDHDDHPLAARARERLEAILGDPLRRSRVEAEEVEAECRGWASLAESYIAHRRRASAEDFLRRIRDIYPETPHARKAAARLVGLDELEWETDE